MMTTSREWAAQVLGHKRRLDEYKETVSRLFPALPKDLVDSRSIRDVDSLVLALFLRCYPHELGVLEVGTFFGVSTFHLASQPSVLRVLAVDPEELPEDGEAGETSRTLDPEDEPEPRKRLRSVDVARAALAEFADESAKVELRTGDVGSACTASTDDSPEGSEKLPAHGLSEDQPLLAFVNGARTREAVGADLQAIFGFHPRAITILDHCRGVGGHFVQAGIAGFVEASQSGYHFRLFGDLSSGMATSHLGIVYPDVDSAEVHRCLKELGHLFSERLDPLWLASREQELIGILNMYRDEAASLNGQLQESLSEHQLLAGRNTELQKRNSQLKRRTTQLEENNSRLKGEKKGLQGRVSQLDKGRSRLEERIARLQERNVRLAEERSLLDSQLGDFRSAGRYKLADAVTKSVLRLPGAKALARRTRPEE